MPDSTENQAPQGGTEQPFTPVPAPAQPVAAVPQKSGSSAVKIILIVVAVFVGIGIIVAGVVGYGIYRVAHAVHKAADGQISFNTPGGSFSANTAQSVSESDLGIAIYPGATQGKGALHMAIAGKTMVTANYLTSDSKDQVLAFYKDKAGPDAQTMTTDDGGLITINKGAESITITVVQQPNQNNGKTQITIVHATGGSN